jgi:hypothetical protein
MTRSRKIPEDAMRSGQKHLELNLHAVRRDAEENWTPGQALGEILAYLNRVDNFTESEAAAFAVQKRMRWLSAVLQAAGQRAKLAGLDPAQLTEIFRALGAYDIALSVERAVTTPSARAACQLIRLEVSYLMPSTAAR